LETFNDCRRESDDRTVDKDTRRHMEGMEHQGAEICHIRSHDSLLIFQSGERFFLQQSAGLALNSLLEECIIRLGDSQGACMTELKEGRR
jgi:hypothetical protein